MLGAESYACWLQRFLFAAEEVVPLRGHRIRSAAPGIHHTVVATQQGKVLAFGRTTYGRLGRLNDDYKSNEARETPLPADGLHGVKPVSVSAGASRWQEMRLYWHGACIFRHEQPHRCSMNNALS